MLAVEGDLAAQRLLVGELRGDVRASRAHPYDEVGWMSVLRTAAFLEALFEILERVYPSSDDEPGSW